ncbi:MAG: DEAD/DEAH box helicase family protein, partial [Rikenellaceae bacterium]|nr:DEAD/DEAH box helicase family protein [Rikenellaceae bacterium]
MAGTELYADVILPLAIEGTYTYTVPEALTDTIQHGARVVVPLGPRKYYTGIVYRVHGDKPAARRLRSIVSVTDSVPVVHPRQMKFWEWLARYYLCGIGEVMKAAIPAALKSSGYTEGIQERYSAKTETHICLDGSLAVEEAFHTALDSLHRAKAQQSALLRLSALLNPEGKPPLKSYSKSRFIQGGYASAAVLKALTDKGYIRTVEVEVSRYDTAQTDTACLPVLTPAQQTAIEEIGGHFSRKKTTLLHGITGSGKTEIYIHLIQNVLQSGKDALYLLPEIALTTQLIERLQNYFGNRVVVYHSRFNDNMRAECYLNVMKTDRRPVLILG